MRYVLIFQATNAAQWNLLTNERFPDGVIEVNPLTQLELLPSGPMAWQLRFDAITLGHLVAIVRDRLDEVAPPTPEGGPT
jgi:hypothetical protein